MTVDDQLYKIKIAIVAPSFRYVGGLAVQADLLLRLWQDDPEIQAIFIAMDPPLPKWGAWAKAVRGLRTLLREPVYLALLWRALAKVEVVHIFGTSYWSFLITAGPAWLLGKFRGKKTVLNYHNGHARDHLRRFRSGTFVLSRSDEIVVPSQYLVDVLNEFGLHATVIPNLVDLSQFHYRQRSPLRPYLICTRSMSRDYGIDVVVRAFARIKGLHPDARLDLVGEGPLENDIRRLVTDLKLGDVRFCGVASRKEIGTYYDTSHIFINASRVDAMPASVIEAFRAGTPVVTTSPEAVPYLVEHERTGLLSAVDDEEALADNVLRLLGDPSLAQQLSRNAYEESRQYEWAAVRGRWVDLYRDVMAGLPAAAVPNKPLQGHVHEEGCFH